MSMHTHSYTYTIYTNTHTDTHTQVLYPRTYMHIQTHMDTYTYIYIHTYTYTRACTSTMVNCKIKGTVDYSRWQSDKGNHNCKLRFSVIKCILTVKHMHTYASSMLNHSMLNINISSGRVACSLSM